MAYIFINPVVDAMYLEEELDAYLTSRGYVRVECREAWPQLVVQQYDALLAGGESSVLDARCPKAAELAKSMQPDAEIAAIEPILIQCARELAAREDLADDEKLITTPCAALEEIGKRLELPDTSFISWNRFIGEDRRKLHPVKLEESPVPPGYFSSLSYSQASVSGEMQLREYFSGEDYKKVRLTEMLFCPEGCHMGDGVN